MELMPRLLSKFSQAAFLVLFAALLVAPSWAQQVVLKDGFVVHIHKYHVSADKLYYVGDDGKQTSILLSDINLALTQQLNAEEKTALKLPGMSNTRKTTTADQKTESLGELAQRLRPKNLKPATQRVFTNENFQSEPASAGQSNVSKPLSNAQIRQRAEDMLREASTKTEQLFAIDALGDDLEDIQFPGRSRWEEQLYESEQKLIADARLCLSNRVSDKGPPQDAACSNLDWDEAKTDSLKSKGREMAREWKSRK